MIALEQMILDLKETVRDNYYFCVDELIRVMVKKHLDGC